MSVSQRSSHETCRAKIDLRFHVIFVFMFVGRMELNRGVFLLFPSLLGFHDRGTGASQGHYWQILHQSDKRAEAWSVRRTQVKPFLLHLSPAALHGIISSGSSQNLFCHSETH